MDFTELTEILPLELVYKIMYTHGGFTHPCAIIIKNMVKAILIPHLKYGDLTVEVTTTLGDEYKFTFIPEDFPFVLLNFFNLKSSLAYTRYMVNDKYIYLSTLEKRPYLHGSSLYAT